MGRRGERLAGGFTLVEALAAGVILAISAVALGAIAGASVRSLGRAREYQTAAALLDEVLTRVDLVGPARLSTEGTTEGVFAPPRERYSWSVTISPELEGYLYDVSVRVQWPTAGGRVRSAEAQTLLNDPPGARDATAMWDDL